MNHRTASVELREQLAVSRWALDEMLAALVELPMVDEAVVLSTCNRVEFWIATENSGPATAQLDAVLCARSGLFVASDEQHRYSLFGIEAARHLFRVASGLDSMVLGESEIMLQVKQAYSAAQEAGTTGPVLNRLFQQALRGAKQVRSHTRIASGHGSIGSVAVRLARQEFGKALTQCNVLLWGAGKAAEITTKHLIRAGVPQVWIVNRTSSKARDLAELCSGGWLAWEQALEHLAHVDIAIVCTEAPHYVLSASDLHQAQLQRRDRRLFLIDLAVPRNIDPAVADVPGVELYDIDDLHGMAEEALAVRQQEVTQCETLIGRHVDRFVHWWRAHARRETELCISGV